MSHGTSGMLRKRLGLVTLSATAMLSVLLVPVAPAQAASDTTVKISKIPNVKLHGKASKAVSPKVKTGKAVKLVSKTLTVKKGSKTVARNKKKVSLKAGNYKVTTTVKYKTRSTTSKLVSDGSVAVAMQCKVVDTELNNVLDYDVTLMFLDCTGAFDGIYEARMGYINDADLRDLIGPNLWGDSFVEHPNEVPPVIGTKFAAKVMPVERTLYKSEVKLSKVKSKQKAQTLKVSK